MGLTLAEISLVLLFSFLVAFVPAYERLAKAVGNPGDVAKLQKELDGVRAENNGLKDEIEKLKAKKNLRSAAVPSCAEVTQADWLFTAVVRGSDDYYVDGQQYSLESLLNKFSMQMSEADKNRCRHRIKLYYDKNISLKEYDYALRRIEQHFYDSKLGPES